jgi:hypothetical protein
MKQVGRDGEIFGESARMGKTEFGVGGFADVGEAHATVAAFSTVDKAFGDDLLTGDEVLDVWTYGFYSAAPGMAGDDGIAVEAVWSLAFVEFYVAATEGDGM